MKIVFLASIIRHKLCIIYAFFYFLFDNYFLTKNYFLIAATNLTTRYPLYTCLVKFVSNSKRPLMEDSVEGEDLDTRNERQRVLSGGAEDDLLRVENLTKVRREKCHFFISFRIRP